MIAVPEMGATEQDINKPSWVVTKCERNEKQMLRSEWHDVWQQASDGDAGMGRRKRGGACSEGNLVTGHQELTFHFERETHR